MFKEILINKFKKCLLNFKHSRLLFLACCMDMHMQALGTTFDFHLHHLDRALRVSGLSDKKSGIPQKKNVYLMEKSGFSKIFTTWKILAN